MNFKTLTTILLLCSLILLSGCGAKPDAGATTWDTRSTLYITTQLISTNNSKGSITKNAKVLGVSDVIITSQVVGRVTSIPGQLGQAVWPNSSLVRLADTNGTIMFGLKRNRLVVDSANNTYAIQKANLEKQIEDAQLTLQRVQLTTNLARADTSKQLTKLDYDLASINPLVTGSNTQIQLDSLRQQLAKAQFDYQTKLSSDGETITGFLLTAKNIHTDISNLTTDIITESDKILWLTDQRRIYNDSYEAYISAKDFNAKNKAENNLTRLIWLQDELKKLWAQSQNITADKLTAYLQSYRTILTAINELIASMKDVLNATVASSQLPQSWIDGLIAQYNWLAARSSGITSSITAQVNGINWFIWVYIQWQQSLAKQIDLLKNQIALTEKSLADAQFNTQLWWDRTRLALDNQIAQNDLNLTSSQSNANFITNTKDLNLDSIQNQLKSAQLALNELNFNAAKFTILSPIRGIVSDILVDIGQDVNPWTPIARVVSNQQELEITVTESEKKFIQQKQKIAVSNQSQSTYGTVTSVSKIADRNGNFIVKVAIDDAMFDVGVFVDVKIDLQNGNPIIPVNAVTIVDTNRGQITLWNGNEIINRSVWLWSLFGEMIEITNSLEPGLVLVTSDISNYDKAKQKITVKKKN